MLGTRALEPQTDNSVHSLTCPAEADGRAQFLLSCCIVGLLCVHHMGTQCPEITS